jgi:hypothetical protein
MDLMRARVALRERPLLDVLDLAFRFCAAHLGAYSKVSCAVVVPGFLFSWAVARAGGWWMAWTTVVVLSSFAGAPFVALASRLVFADDVRAREALALALRAVPRLAGARFVQLLALAASTLLSGLPWLWAGTAMLFVVEVSVLEQAGVGASLGRAQRIANAQFSTALLAMILLGLAPLATAMLFDVAGRELLQGLLEVKAPRSMFADGGSALALLGWWLALPLAATARFFVYLDIRTRAEGWDIQTRFAAIATRAESAGAAS